MALVHELSSIQILVLDDEPDLRTLYELTLLREGYQVEVAATVEEAWAQLNARRFDLVITDMRLPDGSGIDLLKGVRAQQRTERCIVITAFGSAENAVESLKAGAFDYLTKPVDLKQFRSAVAAAAQSARSAAHAPRTSAAYPAGAQRKSDVRGDLSLSHMAGDSLAMRNVRERIIKVARSMAPVMVRGESGTGKELVARALHANSHRREGPWVAVNCSAIPSELLEAEFFGAKKGAYTGAQQDRSGFFQAAHGGTLFLDEIGDLPLSMQAKLLRAVQEKQVRPLGGTQEESVDVRIVSATHKNLPAEVAAGKFRQDLFYRLNVIDIDLPPLRDRPEDLPALCQALLQRISQESGQPMPHVPPGFIARLASLPLLGNVRELENILHRATALADGAATELSDACLDGMASLRPASDFPTTVAGELARESAMDSPGVAHDADVNANANAHAPSALESVDGKSAVASAASAVTATASAAPSKSGLPSDLQAYLDNKERLILVRALRETGFNRTLAAKLLGLSLRQIRYRIARLRIDAPDMHGEDPDD